MILGRTIRIDTNSGFDNVDRVMNEELVRLQQEGNTVDNWVVIPDGRFVVVAIKYVSEFKDDTVVKEEVKTD